MDNSTLPYGNGSVPLDISLEKEPFRRLKIPCAEAGKPEYWWIFLLSSLFTPLVLAFLIFAYHVVKSAFCVAVRVKNMRASMRAAPIPDLSPTIELSPEMTTEYISDCVVKWDRFEQIRLRTQELISTKFVSGEISIFLLFLTSQASYLIYLTEVSRRRTTCCLELCYTSSLFDDTSAVLDFFLNCLFAVHFCIRFMASNKKLSFLYELYSVIDYFTVPPAMVAVFLNRSWTGLRFLRVLYLLNIPDILQYLRILRTRNSLRLAQLVCSVVSALLMSAGMFHLLEHSGDPFYPASDVKKATLSYWEYVYFCIATASTVGYGDIVCETVFGRIFNAVFIMSTLAVVASVIPDIFRIISNRKKYAGRYEDVAAKKHIIVCGNVNFVSALGFLKEFLHKDRGVYDIKVLFMDVKEPDMEMETLLKRYFTEVEYFQGSAMNSHDLQRVKANFSEACIIVANKHSPDPDAEDAANIMRVIAIKNFNSSTRVIVELMQYHNKAYLLNIPSWNWKNGDEVVCLAELKLGLIAQSCIAPGFSTLMANLFTSRSFSSLGKETWKSEYLRGTGLEMYSENLSSAFTNMSFAQSAEICLLRLDILLIALSFWDPKEEDFTFIINPKPDTKITANTQGFFIADSAEDVQRVLVYCHSCHSHVERISAIKKCSCRPVSARGGQSASQNALARSNSPRRISMIKPQARDSSKTKQEKVEIFIQNYPSTPQMKRGVELVDAMASMTNRPAGSKHLALTVFRVPQEYGQKHSLAKDNILLKFSDNSVHVSSSHPNVPQAENKFLAYLVVPLFKNNTSASESSDSIGDASVTDDTEGSDVDLADAKFDSTGMFHWCAPRPFESAVIDRHVAAKRHFRRHVVVGIFTDDNSPLIGLNSLVMPLRSSNFRYEDLQEVVILGNTEYLKREWKNLYNFPKVTLVKGTALSRADLRALSIHSCSMCVVLTAKIPNYTDSTLTDKEVIMASLNIKAMDFEPRATSRHSRPASISGVQNGVERRQSVPHVPGVVRRKLRPGARIPMITDLFNDPNVQFLDPDDEDNDDQEGFFATEPFACGSAFTASVLDSLMSMVYFNPCAFRVVRALIFGGASSELEEILAEGAGLIGGPTLCDEYNRNRSFISQVRMKDPPFANYANSTFGAMFVAVLREYGILCLGLSRLMIESRPGDNSNPSKRYVVTKPPAGDSLRESDNVFVLMQSDYNDAPKQATDV